MISHKVKVILAALLAILASPTSAYSKNPTLTLGGSLDLQSGYLAQKGAFKTDMATPPAVPHKLDSYGMVNDTKLRIVLYGRTRAFRYGALMVLNTDTSQSKEGESSVAYQTMMYTESCIGRLEAGSYTGAYDAMRVSGASIARASGGIDGDWRYWANTDVDSAFSFVTGAGTGTLIYSPSLPTAFDKSYEANASKITYYTPVFKFFRAGITYIPDTDQHGTITNLKGLTKYTTLSNAYNQTVSYTNVFQGGLSYKARCQDVHFEVSVLGEIGKPKPIANGPVITTRHDLKAYEIGGGIHYRNFSVASSYGDWGKSGLAKVVNITPVAGAKSGHYWTLGASYVHKCLGISAGYLSSENGGFGSSITSPAYSPIKGKATLYSLGVDYRITKALMPYAEITLFNLKDKALGDAGKNDGSVFLIGSKLEF